MLKGGYVQVDNNQEKIREEILESDISDNDSEDFSNCEELENSEECVTSEIMSSEAMENSSNNIQCQYIVAEALNVYVLREKVQPIRGKTRRKEVEMATVIVIVF